MQTLPVKTQAASLAAEAIHFQSTVFFDELVKALGVVREAGLRKLSLEAFYKHKTVKNITDMIQKRTGLNIEFSALDSEYGPAILPAPTTEKHIFHILNEFRQHHAQVSSLKQADVHKQSVFMGVIDLKKGVVTGDFCKFESYLMIPRSCLEYGVVYNHATLSLEEVAAVVLHEVGHAFTAFEYLNRTATTNQILAGLSEAYDQGPDVFGVVLEKYIANSDDPPEVKKALKNAKSIQNVAYVVYGAEIENCYSQLGASVFDATSCEQLADQFAVRMGAGRHLATGLSKLPIGRKQKGTTVANNIVQAFGLIALFGCPPALVLVGICTLISVMSADRKDIYGDFESRLARVRGDLVEQLKLGKFGAEGRQVLLDDIKVVEDLLSQEESTLDLMDGIAYYLRPSFRNAYKYEMLQRQLEQLASNGLFVKAEQLKALAEKK